MCLWGGWGGNFIILSAGLENVPKSLYEASSIDGCSSFKKILHVTIPGIKGQLVLCLFTTIIGYLGLYGQNYVLTAGGPYGTTLPGSGRTSTVMYFIQDIVANNLNLRAAVYGLGAAASIVFAIFVGIISGIQMYLTRDKKTGTKISERYAKWKLAK
jgi:multiple sugar transport system permease protein